MREGRSDVFYFLREGPDLLLGLAYGPIKTSLDGLCGASALLGCRSHGFDDGRTEAISLPADRPEIRSYVVRLVSKVLKGAFRVPGTCGRCGCASLELAAHVTALLLGVLCAVPDALQASKDVAELLYRLIQVEVHSKGELSAVCHALTSFLRKNGAVALLRPPLFAPCFVVKNPGGNRLLIFRQVHALHV